MTMAEKLLSLRTGQGLSQEDLAEKLGVSRQSVSKWETGQSVPDLDKIIRLADLFGVTVDELVREGEPPAPEPPREDASQEAAPQVVYVERERDRGLTPVQVLGVVCMAAGAGMVVLSLLGAALLMLAGIALAVLGLPLLLARRHPLLIAGWLAVAMSLAVFNPYTSVSPWGLVGGLRRLYVFIAVPEFRSRAAIFAIAIGIARGTLTLALLFFTGRAWVRRRKKDG